MADLYKPPEGQPSIPITNGSLAHKELLWVVRIGESWDSEDDLAFDDGEPAAKRKLSDPDRYSIDAFCIPDGRMYKQVKERDRVVQVESGDGESLIYPGWATNHLKPYEKTDGSKWLMVFLERDTEMLPLNVDQAIYRLGSARLRKRGSILREIRTPRRITDRDLASAILHLWPSTAVSARR